VVVAVVLACAGVANAGISIVAEGEILTGSSWGQKFVVTDIANKNSFDVLGIQVAFAKKGGSPLSFEADSPSLLPLRDIAPTPPTWKVTDVSDGDSVYSAIATGPNKDNSVSFEVWFKGDKPTTEDVTFDFFAAAKKRDEGQQKGQWEWMGWFGLEWKDESWSSKPCEQEPYELDGERGPCHPGCPPAPQVPEPGTLVIWGVGGLCAAGAAAMRRRRKAGPQKRARWSDETRNAIFAVVHARQD
jgi:hypothetical protein